MSRAAGRRRTGREPELSPGEVREFGIDDRDIPGGRTHLINPVTVAQKTPVAEPLAPHRGMMAHGVPPEGEHYDRDGKGKAYQPQSQEIRPKPIPVPVYIVETSAGSSPLRVVATRHFQAPAIGGEPAMLCGEDTNRRSIQIINTDASHAAWIGQLSDLAFDGANNKVVGGAFLPKGMTGYLKLEHQGPMWVCSDDSGTPAISVIFETDIPGAG